MNNKIGIGVITTGREDLYKQCVASLPKADYTVVVHNGDAYEWGAEFPSEWDRKTYNEVQNVAINKNRALRAMIQNGCDHLFLVEDDVTFSDPEICNNIIKCASESGIWHLNYCPGEPESTMEYTEDSYIDFFKELNTKFTYYHRNIIKHVGYLDERYKTGLSGVDHTYRISKKALAPPFGLFAGGASTGVKELDFNKERSIIDYKMPEGIKAIQNDVYSFLMRHGETPAEVKVPTQQEVENSLTALKDNYSRPL